MKETRMKIKQTGNRTVKVYVIGPNMGYSRFVKGLELVDDISKAEVVILTGGADINPEIYHAEAHPTTYFYDRRDKEELDGFSKVRPDQIVVGICRGAQLICALYGGILIQDVTNHAGGGHTMINAKGDVFPITSLHHQMLYPWDLDKNDYDILFWTTNRLSRHYWGDKVDSELVENTCEPEIAVFHREGMPTCLGVQGHPEMMGRCETVDLVNSIMLDLIDGTYDAENYGKKDFV